MPAFDWQSYNTIYGASNNPWNVSRSLGGPSGGSAGSVAAGFSVVELGSDLDGSIRVPSHFCGIYGHRPSYGLMPLRRHVPPLPGKLNRFELGVAGPMAHSAFDLELALDLLISPAALERKAWRIELPASRRDKLSDFRVAVWADDSEFSVDSGVRTAIETCVDWACRLTPKHAPPIDLKKQFDSYIPWPQCWICIRDG